MSFPIHFQSRRLLPHGLSKRILCELRSTRGSAIITALILMGTVSIVIAAVLQTATLEARLTYRNNLKLLTDNTAELLADYGLGELARRFDEEVAFAEDEFLSGKNPLSIRNELTDKLATLDIDIDSLVLFGGRISTKARYFVDPDLPANKGDPLQNKWIFVRNVHFYARASSIDTSMGQSTSYAQLTVQLRDAPLTSNAIFYNMDLEFHPGPDMVIDGPVHANGNIWLMSQEDLQFEDIVTCTGDLRVGFMRTGSNDDWASSGSVWTGKGVAFRNADDDWQTLYRGKGTATKSSSYYISTTPDSDFDSLGYNDWREYATNEFGGNILTGAHGVSLATPSGVEPYVPSTSSKVQKENHGYVLIEPAFPLSSAYHKGEAEDVKMVRKAGLIIRVHRDLNGNGVDDDRGGALPANAVQLRLRPDQDDGWSTASEDYLIASGGSLASTMRPENFILSDLMVAGKKKGGGGSTGGGSTSTFPAAYNTGYYLSFASIRRTSSTDPNSDPVFTKTEDHTITNASGDERTVTYSEISEIPVVMADGFDFTNSDSDTTSDGDKLRCFFDRAFAVVPSMHDQRVKLTSGQIYDLSLVEINLAALADILENVTPAMFKNYVPSIQYNGIVYVEFPLDPAFTPRTKDKIWRSVEGMGLILTEAGGPDPEMGRVPNNSGRDPGFTLVTNQAVYVRGPFNADGNLSTPSTGSVFGPDSQDDGCPAMIMADAVTILSDNWKIANSTSSTPPKAVANEFSGAIVAGILPTNEGGRSVTSGGNHNFMRFLENWDGLIYRYRGSMVCAYESEIQNEQAYNSHYDPPNRQWGFNRAFATGSFPPGTPVYKTFRKLDFKFLTREEFEAAQESDD